MVLIFRNIQARINDCLQDHGVTFLGLYNIRSIMKELAYSHFQGMVRSCIYELEFRVSTHYFTMT